MQSLKNLALMVSEKKPTFFFDLEKCRLSPLSMCNCQKGDIFTVYVIYQSYEALTWIRTQNFQLQPFDSAVSLKYGQGH